MKKHRLKNFCVGSGLLGVFVLWTIAVVYVDVRAIGPRASEVGFAVLNGFFHGLTGVHMPLYTVTDWLGLVPVAVALGFAVMGLAQWIKRKNLLEVDYSLLAMGVFYIVVAGVYLIFETVVVNYRPVLINGFLEASYPSSTTVLAMCVMPTAAMQFDARIKNRAVRRSIIFAGLIFTVFMVIGRLVSGVHWITDIIGGALLSAGLVEIYRGAVGLKK